MRQSPTTFKTGHFQDKHIDQFVEQLVVFDTQSFFLTPEKTPLVTQNADVSFVEKRRKFLEFLTTRSVTIAGLFSISIDGFLDLKIYVCIQSLMKMHPLFDHALLKILLLDPKSIILLLRNDAMSSWQNKLYTRLSSEMDAFNISLSRVLFISQMNTKDYMYAVCNADVTLDPFPFGMHRITRLSIFHYIFPLLLTTSS